ncbi:hypothetical protein KAU43_01360 [candidate division WOR-3 bacterium]|nr:hypothetical protein [candidate division WOR-3 bacterium]
MNYQKKKTICLCQKELQTNKPHILMPDGSKHALYCKVPKEIFPHCLRCGSDLINNKGRSYGRWLCCKCNQYIIYHSNELVKKKKNEYNKMYYKQRLIKEKKREYDELKLMCFTDEEIIEIIELRKEFGKLTTETLMRSYSDIEMDIGEIFTESVIGYILKEREFKK